MKYSSHFITQSAITLVSAQNLNASAITASNLVTSQTCVLCHVQLILSNATLAEEGHMARDCRNQPRYNGPPRNFGMSGRPSGGAPNRRVFCYKCGGANHFSRDCKASDVKCYNCNGFGHLSRDCPEGPKAQVCYKCQQEGHISRDCPQAQRDE
ncbi:hypothetical protein BGX26_001421 [Mortierella sp. AD094]|nr:hypothetical protein BGX26_001421 [Mortierella sp. AD094]